MKRLISVLVTIVLLASLGCTAHDPHSGGEEKPEESAGAQASAPAVTALLPDWPAEDGQIDGWVTYRNVSPAKLREYTDLLEEQGFTLVENEEGRWAKILYRADAWVEIADNTDSYGYCDVKVSLDTHTGGMDEVQARAALEANYLDHEANRPEGELVSVLEITPEGLFDGAGMQLFRALFDARPKPSFTDPVYSTVTFLAAGSTAYEVFYYDCVCADIDSDGQNEAVMLEYGPTSGLFSLIFEAFGVENGELSRKAASGYTLDFGLSSLAAHDGRVFYVWQKQFITSDHNAEFAEPVEFGLSAENGRILIDDPENVLDSMGFYN